MSKKIHTDLAMEAHELWKKDSDQTTKLSGVEAYDEAHGGFRINTVRILDERGSDTLGKPVGTYITLQLDGLINRQENAFSTAAELLSQQLRGLIKLPVFSSFLVAGLGNNAITPDAIGPETLRSILVTRHLKTRVPEAFAGFKDVAAVQSGVLGTTGIESADIISSVCSRLNPDVVIAIDALASLRTDRLCRTVQISDTGIVPGSGVGNTRSALNQDTLGIPVIAIGVPTVVDAATMAAELVSNAGITLPEDASFGENADLIVTPRDIDSNVRDISKIIGYGINLALHDGLTIEDIDMFLG